MTVDRTFPGKVVARYGEATATLYEPHQRLICVADKAAFADLRIALQQLEDEATS